MDEFIQNQITGVSGFLGVSEAEVMSSIGLAKAEKNGPGGMSVGTPTLGLTEPTLNTLSDFRGVRNRLGLLPYKTLRNLSERNDLANAAIAKRTRDVKPYLRPSRDKEEPGFVIRLKDPDATMNRNDKAQAREITEFLLETGRRDFDGAEDREDSLVDLGIRAVRDYFNIDRVPIELRWDRAGRPLDFWMHDGATVKTVLNFGYGGQRSDFDPRQYVSYNAVVDEITKTRLNMVPHDLSRIRYVQEVDNRLVAAFTRDTMIVDSAFKRSDIDKRDFGYSPIEQALNVMLAWSIGLQYNTSAFNSNLPRVGIAFKDSNFTQEELDHYQQRWMANLQGFSGAWKTPFFSKDVSVIDIMKNSRDMDYKEFMQISAAVVFAILGLDSAELGLKFTGSQNVLSESIGGQQQFSKATGLGDTLSELADLINKIMRKFGWSRKFEFAFTGLEVKDRQAEAQLRETKQRTNMTIDESRALDDKAPIGEEKGGNLILNPVYLQYIQSKAQQSGATPEQGGEGESVSSQDVETAMDQSIDELFKADGPIKKMRTMLV